MPVRLLFILLLFLNTSRVLAQDSLRTALRTQLASHPQASAKIFSTFFTTKPSGQGTGLGLSLAYDIVTKSHGGTLSVDSREGEGTAFVIRLPVSS